MAGGGAVKGIVLLLESRMNTRSANFPFSRYQQKYHQTEGVGLASALHSGVWLRSGGPVGLEQLQNVYFQGTG
ncbi:hypothetical protein L512_4985 [Bordetella bronchiseptica MBORD624]|nr:hypothetical protein L512_4985 [Bordetella bronchiseptica MBORD624]